jgi:hypothetical protein
MVINITEKQRKHRVRNELRWKEIQELTRQAVARYKRGLDKIATIEKTRSTKTIVGDAYWSPVDLQQYEPECGAYEYPIELVVVSSLGNGKFYCVPADDHPFVGSADVTVPEDADFGPMTLRCGLGLWLNETQLSTQKRSGTIPTETVKRANKILSKIVASSLEGTSLQKETDCDPDYKFLMRGIFSAVEGVRSSLTTQKI